MLGGMGMIVTAVVMLVHRSPKNLVPPGTRPSRIRAATVCLCGVIALGIYPEHLIEGTATHLLTVVAGDLILFTTMRSLLTALVPYEASAQRVAADERPGLGLKRNWEVVLLIGFFLGLLLFAGETSGDAGRVSLGQTVFVAAIFVGLSITGLAAAYAFLGTPLGLKRRS
jgi:hypothetical protein